MFNGCPGKSHALLRVQALAPHTKACVRTEITVSLVAASPQASIAPPCASAGTGRIVGRVRVRALLDTHAARCRLLVLHNKG